MSQPTNTNSSFNRVVLLVLAFIAMVFYFGALIYLGDLSVNNPNDDRPPTVDSSLLLLTLGVETALAVNFGAVMGVQLGKNLDGNQMIPPTLSSKLRAALASLWNEIKKLGTPELLVVVYIASIAVSAYFYISAGGFTGSSAKISPPIANQFVSFIGAFGGIIGAVAKRS